MCHDYYHGFAQFRKDYRERFGKEAYEGEIVHFRWYFMSMFPFNGQCTNLLQGGRQKRQRRGPQSASRRAEGLPEVVRRERNENRSRKPLRRHHDHAVWKRQSQIPGSAK